MIDFLLRSNGDAVASMLEALLDDLTSPRTSSAQRIELLQSLENLFGRAVLTPHEKTRDAHFESAWWSAQSRPETCTAIALLSLIHRLHLTATLKAHTSKQFDPSDELTASLTILQGLCLKDATTSRPILSKSSSITLILDVVRAPYWSTIRADSAAIAHAVDLLICVTMSSPAALRVFDTVDGEDVIRLTMERYAKKHTMKTQTPVCPLVTLDDVQDSAIAMKCAEFLILYASEQDDVGSRTVEIGHTSAYVDTSVVQHFARKHHKDIVQSATPKHRQNSGEHISTSHQPSNMNDRTASVIQRSRRARSMSPMKVRESDKRMRVAAAAEEEVAQGSRSPSKQPAPPTKSFPPPMLRSISPSKLSKSGTRAAPFSRRIRSSIEDQTNEHATPKRSPPDRGTRPPLLTLEQGIGNGQAEMSAILPLPSPLKNIIGPSPAVRRVQERSASPEKGGRRIV